MLRNKRFQVILISSVLLLGGLGLLAINAGAGPGLQAPAAPPGPIDVISDTISFQGRLLGQDGVPVDGTQVMTFSLYAEAVGGVPLWSQGGPVEVSAGLLDVDLEVNPAHMDGRDLWLGVQMEGETEMTPRQALLPAPHALYALQVPWTGVGQMPAGFADGVDDDLLAGMSCGFGEIAKWDGAAWICALDDSLLNTPCSPGEILKWDGAAWICAPDDDSTYSAGTGLELVGDQFSVGPTYRLPQSCAGSQVAKWDGSDWQCGDDVGSGDFWSLNGNAGTDPQVHFLGTTDGASLTLAVNGEAALRLEPQASSPNLIGGHGANAVNDGAAGAVIGGGGDGSTPNRVTDDYGVVGGGVANRAGDDDGDPANARFATVGGGWTNVSSGNAATIGGGFDNSASGTGATVAGGAANTASGPFVTIGGGDSNTASGDRAAIIGGNGVTASGDYATAGGGLANAASGHFSFVGGGFNNVADGDEATVAGGFLNAAIAQYAAIGGGGYNIVTAEGGTVAGGTYITVTGNYASVGGGYQNIASGLRTTIAGGEHNTASGTEATIAGGRGNTASDVQTTVGGGMNNTASEDGATIGGGLANTADGGWATISGGFLHIASGVGSTIGGGCCITVTGYYATVGGGEDNTASSQDATIGGGAYNTASGGHATIGGGTHNTANADDATIGGGYQNTASGYAATIAGGQNNTASGFRATIGGGYNNEAPGSDATVPGGTANRAEGEYSLAAGRRAKAYDDGCFVWGDSTDADIICTNPNRFVARATGGFYLYTSGDTSTGVYVGPGGSGWNSVSNRELKENFTPVDTQDLLERLAGIEISTWNYRSQDPSIRHVGPMAQDFNVLLPDLGGEGPEYINSVDADGVALAAIQGLYAQNQALEAEVTALRAEVGGLEARLAALEQDARTSPGAGLRPSETWRLLWLGGLTLAGVVVGWQRWIGGER